MTLSHLNAAFELVGAVLAWRSVLLILREPPRGVSVAMLAFSGLWAIVAPPYYLSHDESWSAGFSAVRCLGLLTWSYLAVRSKKTSRPES